MLVGWTLRVAGTVVAVGAVEVGVVAAVGVAPDERAVGVSLPDTFLEAQ
jgi:hypothetical protein